MYRSYIVQHKLIIVGKIASMDILTKYCVKIAGNLDCSQLKMKYTVHIYNIYIYIIIRS